MNESSVRPERAWQMVLDQLRSEMSIASFDTWVSNTRFAVFDEGLFSVATPSNFGREWLASRLTSTVSRMLTAILGQPVEVKFVV